MGINTTLCCCRVASKLGLISYCIPDLPTWCLIAAFRVVRVSTSIFFHLNEVLELSSKMTNSSVSRTINLYTVSAETQQRNRKGDATSEAMICAQLTYNRHVNSIYKKWEVQRAHHNVINHDGALMDIQLHEENASRYKCCYVLKNQWTNSIHMPSTSRSTKSFSNPLNMVYLLSIWFSQLDNESTNEVRKTSYRLWLEMLTPLPLLAAL